MPIISFYMAKPMTSAFGAKIHYGCSYYIDIDCLTYLRVSYSYSLHSLHSLTHSLTHSHTLYRVLGVPPVVLWVGGGPGQQQSWPGLRCVTGSLLLITNAWFDYTYTHMIAYGDYAYMYMCTSVGGILCVCVLVYRVGCNTDCWACWPWLAAAVCGRGCSAGATWNITW